MSFRKIKLILTESPGDYVNGIWVAGVRSYQMILASIQPVSKEKDLMPLPEGRHMSDYCKLYSDVRLQVTADGENKQPDIFVHLGYGYEIVSIDMNQSDVINHYKYTGVKVFQYTNVADWISGATKRP